MKFFLLSILIIFISCSSDKKFDESFIKKISEIKSNELSRLEPPSKHSNFMIFVKISKDEVSILNVDDLYNIYKSHYNVKYNDFYTFLDNVINKNLILNIKLSFPSFFIDFDKIRNVNFSLLRDTKLKKINEGYILSFKNESKFEPLDLMSFLYLFYSKGYLISPNDYNGTYFLKKE